jgi:hypothetical protein
MPAPSTVNTGFSLSITPNHISIIGLRIVCNPNEHINITVMPILVIKGMRLSNADIWNMINIVSVSFSASIKNGLFIHANNSVNGFGDEIARINAWVVSTRASFNIISPIMVCRTIFGIGSQYNINTTCKDMTTTAPKKLTYDALLNTRITNTDRSLVIENDVANKHIANISNNVRSVASPAESGIRSKTKSVNVEIDISSVREIGGVLYRQEYIIWPANIYTVAPNVAIRTTINRLAENKRLPNIWSMTVIANWDSSRPIVFQRTWLNFTRQRSNHSLARRWPVLRIYISIHVPMPLHATIIVTMSVRDCNSYLG